MWVRIRETLRLWLLHGYEPPAKALPAGADAPLVMTMEDAGNANVQKAPASSGPVHMSMQGVGSGNVQVGCAEALTIQVGGPSPAGPVTTATTTTYVYHQHFYGATAPVVEPGSQPMAANSAPNLAPVVALSPPGKPCTTEEQKQLLNLMKPLDKETRIKVLNFMREQFQTPMVVELQPQQVYRTRRYVEKVRSNLGQRQRA